MKPQRPLHKNPLRRFCPQTSLIWPPTQVLLLLCRRGRPLFHKALRKVGCCEGAQLLPEDLQIPAEKHPERYELFERFVRRANDPTTPLDSVLKPRT